MATCTVGAREALAQTEFFPIDGAGGASINCVNDATVQKTGRPFGASPSTVTGCTLAGDTPFGLGQLSYTVYCKGGHLVEFHSGGKNLKSCSLAYDTAYLQNGAGAQVPCKAGVRATFEPAGRLISCGEPPPPTVPRAGSSPSQLPAARGPIVPPGGGGAGRVLGTGTPVAVASARVGPAGATLRVDKTGDPLSGLALTVPAGAYAAEREVKVSYRLITRQGYGADVNPVSPLITVEAGAGYAAAGVTVRVPIALPAGHFAMGFYYDETSGRLEGMPLVELAPDHATVLTRHFSSFFITSIAEPLLFGLDFDTGFRPGVDDWQFPNYGSYLNPGGNCAGQSVSAMWYFYERRQVRRAPALFGQYDNNGATPATPSLWEDDSRGYRLASVVQFDIDWNSLARKSIYELEGLDERLAYMSLAHAMRLTAGPQLLVVWNRQKDAGHAIVAYRISGGKVFVADPNMPGRTDRTIAVVNERFGAYNSAERADAQGTVYEEIRHVGMTAIFDWDRVGARWSQLDAGVIGDDLFPSYDTGLYDSKGDGLVLTDGLVVDKTEQRIWVGNVQFHNPGGGSGPIRRQAGLYAHVNGQWTGQWLHDQPRDVVGVTLKPGENTVGLVVTAVTNDGREQWVNFRRYRIRVLPAETPKAGHWALTSTAHAEEQPFESRVPDCPAVRQSATDQSVTFTVAFRGNCTYDKGTATITASWTPPPVLIPGTPFPMALSVNGNSGIVAQDGVNLHRVQGTVIVETDLYQCRGSECRASDTRESSRVAWASFETGPLPSGTVLGATTFQVEASDTPIKRPANFQPADVFRISVRSSEVGEGGGLATTMRHVVVHTYVWQPAR